MKRQEKQVAIEFLMPYVVDEKGYLTRIHCYFKQVSRSGMSRIFQIVSEDHTNLSRFVADVLGWPYSEKFSGVKVSGCGMDMSLHLYDCLLYALGFDDTKEKRQVEGKDYAGSWQKKIIFHE